MSSDNLKQLRQKIEEDKIREEEELEKKLSKRTNKNIERQTGKMSSRDLFIDMMIWVHLRVDILMGIDSERALRDPHYDSVTKKLRWTTIFSIGIIFSACVGTILGIIERAL